MIERTVWVEHRFSGIHCWPGAPEGRFYLATPHRHLFHVRAEITVEHDDREVEFHDLLDEVRYHCAGLGRLFDAQNQVAAGVKVIRDLGSMSCEQVAQALIDRLLVRWPRRGVTVTVSEDGEVGATVRVLSQTG